ncbi:MAG: NAD(P)/FAD-dependent oxidoreductase [Chloroflexi bacterium]|nr:NAD(P)/FAD-dependent oxidoreductase [Chloroflexota bacterium]
MSKTYDAIVVGGGLAGLTAATYLSRAGRSVLMCEQAEKCGGLVNTFERDGFFYDGGIRALEDSGVLFPMLRQLGIQLDFVPNVISIGLEDRVIRLESEASVAAYQDLLAHFYPESRAEIEQIMQQIRTIMHYMDVLYGIENPMFLDFQANKEYMLREVLPWMVKYAITEPKITKISAPAGEFLRRYTANAGLIDIIAQHFFKDTPAYFALSYLKLFLGYYYPRGGTGTFVTKLVEMIAANRGEIRTQTQIVAVDAARQTVRDARGNLYGYRRLIWAADQGALYRALADDGLTDAARGRIAAHKTLLQGKTGNDSVYTLFVGANLPPDYFAGKCTGHFFYTADRTGQSSIGPIPYGQDRQTIETWMEKFLGLTTYEISIPALRDERMAPPGKTGLIISFLFDYKLVKSIEEQGWYDDFKKRCDHTILRVLDRSIFPGLQASVEQAFSSTPVTMQKLTGNHEGAITGWSFTNRPMPVEGRIPKIFNAIRTPIPAVYQAGQWTYSPSGLPVSLLTGKIAADQVLKDLKKSI